MSLPMPRVWVALLVFAIIFFVVLIVATKEHDRQPAEDEQKQHAVQVSTKKGKKSRYREKKQKLREQAEARGQSQNYTNKMEEQGDEMLQPTKDDDMLRETVTAPTQQCEKRDQHFNHQVEVKCKHLEGSPAQNKTKYEEEIANLKEENANLKEENANNAILKEENANLKDENANNAILKEENANLNKENANLKEEIAELKQDRKAQDEQRVPKLEQVSRAKEASSEQVQPVGEDDQTGVPVIHDLNPVATEGEQPRIQFDTVGMEIEVPKFESESKTNERFVAASTKSNNSEDENKSVEDGLKMPHQPFSRRSSFSSEGSAPRVEFWGVGSLQPLSDAKDATITTQIDKEINKKPTGIDSNVTLERALELRQLVIDAAPVIKKWDKKIEPYLQLDEADLRGGLLPKIPFSILLRVLCILVVDKHIHSDIDNDEWLKRHHLTKFRQESGKNWLKENLEPRKAEKRLKFLEKAATASLGNAGRLLVSLYKLYVRTNHQVHPTLDLDKVILYSNEGTYTSDGEDLREVVQLLAGELKNLTS